MRIVARFEAAIGEIALQQLARQLGVVGVLPERVLSPPVSRRITRADDRVDMVLAYLWRLAFEDEAQSVAQTLTDQTATEPRGAHLRAPMPTTARFLCH